DVRLAEHLRRDLASVGRRLGEVNPALESILESPLPSSTCVNLRFHDKIDMSQLARDLLYFIWSRGNFSTRRRDIEFLQQFFGLIFVNIHPFARTTDGAISSRYGSQQRFFCNGRSRLGEILSIRSETTCAMISGPVQKDVRRCVARSEFRAR